MAANKSFLNNQLPWLPFLLITFVFLFVQEFPFIASGGDPPLDFFEKGAELGSLKRRIYLPFLGLYSVASLSRGLNVRVNFDSVTGRLMVLFLSWSVLSVIWSVDPTLTIRRLVVFLIISVVAISMALRFSIDNLPRFTFFFTSLYLIIGIISEVHYGVFNPTLLDHRFAGFSLPNNQAFHCALLSLSAISVGRMSKRWKTFFYLVGSVGFLFLILTKSRTSFASLAAAQFVFLFLVSSKDKILPWLSGLIALISFTILIVGEKLFTIFPSAILLGRNDANVMTFTGRVWIWEECLKYITERPLHGYGFNSFWTLNNIREIYSRIGYPIGDAHSAYIDLLLSVGIVGLLLYLFIIFGCAKKSFLYYKQTNNPAYSFLFKIFLFYLIHGFLESGTIQMGVETMILFWGVSFLAFVDLRQTVNNSIIATGS